MRMGHGSHTSTIRMRRARSADLNEIADLWSDCGLVPSERGFRNEMGRMLIKSPELFLVASETAIDYDHAQDIRAYRHSAARAAERRAADGDGYQA